MSSKSSNKSKIMKIITTPVRVLRKARDFYVTSLINYANHGPHGRIVTVGGGPAGNASNNLRRSFCVNNAYSFQHSEEDLRELIRANSTSRSSCSGNVEQHIMSLQQQSAMGSKSSSQQRAVPRSFSVGLQRIDEDKSFVSKEDFGDVKVKNESMYATRSGVVNKKSSLGN